MADTTTTTYAFTKPEVGASENSWGAKLSANWDKADDLLDGTTAIAPNLTAGTWEIGGVAVTATAAELNKLDGYTGDVTDLNNIAALGTISTQNANSVNIDGGNIDGTTVGGTTPAAGTFTTLTADRVNPDILSIQGAGALTISSGAVTQTGSFHSIATQSGAAEDDLDTITGGTAGDFLILTLSSSSENVTFTEAGNLRLGRPRLRMGAVGDRALFFRGVTNWDLVAFNIVNPDVVELLTIATGAIPSPAGSMAKIAGQGGTDDDLDTIGAGYDGQRVILRAASSTVTITVKDGTGNIRCAGDRALTHSDDKMELVYDNGVWSELSFADNTA